MAGSLDLSVAAWSPPANGVLSGKFTRSGEPGPTRIRHTGQDVSERDLQIAREVDAVADELGATSAQVVLAWTMARHRWVHPLVGARNAGQLAENLAATGLVLPEESVRRLDEVSAIERGFPSDTIESTRGFIYGSCTNASPSAKPGQRPELIRQPTAEATEPCITARPAGDLFLESLMMRLLPGSLAVFADNRLVPGSVHPVARRDEQGNTYQRRQLKDGSSWDVLKNFPEPDEVRTRLSRFGPSAGCEELDNYWLAWCRSPS